MARGGLLATNQIPVIFNHVFHVAATRVGWYAVNFAAAGVLTGAGVKVAFSGGGGSLVKIYPTRRRRRWRSDCQQTRR